MLDPKKHKQYRIRPVSCYRFASHLLSAPIGLNEVVPLSRTCVVAIVRNDLGKPHFHVIMGIEKGENLLLDANGQWRGGAHIPKFLQRYPFIPIEHPGDPEKFSVGVDSTCADFNTTEGQPLFQQYEEGPTQVVKDVIAQLQAFNAQTLAGARLCEELAELDLLEPQTASIQFDHVASERRLDGLMIVNEAKFCALPDETLAKWTRCGATAVILAHLQSLPNFSRFLTLRAS
ncbi:SapC [Caballeronia calidae]|uniref:SapC n=1 Tax=Caballeronia calidae TaxID=1777139 RepID=A0A158ELA7_9BURK|nr:SapC [Caballeronia calidae]